MNKFNLFEEIKENANLRGSQIALIAGDRSVTYDQMIEAAENAASYFFDSGMFEYSKCLLIGEDSPEYIFAALGIISKYGIFTSAGKEITNKQFNDLLKKLNVDFLILEEKFIERLKPIGYNRDKSFAIGEKEYSIFKLSTDIDKAKKSSCLQRTPLVELNSLAKLNPAFIRFTSGTTSKSKGVVLSHQTIRERTEAANSAFNITEKDNVLWLLPMAYHFAVTIILFLRKGATINIANHLTSSEIVNEITTTGKGKAKKQACLTIEGAQPSEGEIGKAHPKDGPFKTTCGSKKDDITFIYATPYHYSNMINEVTSSSKQRTIHDSVRLLISTAMPLSEELFAKFAKTFDRLLNQAYGIIECGIPVVNASPSIDNGTSVGKHLLGYQIRLALKNDEDTFGEIAIKGEGFIDAYLDPWRKKKSILSNGWFYTGDIGTFNIDGTLKIIGRKKSMINFLGLKVFPEIVEEILLQHNLINDVKVFGEEHPTFGEIVIAEYVTGNSEQIDHSELTKFCLDFLSNHEIPQEFRFIKTIKKTGSGKIVR